MFSPKSVLLVMSHPDDEVLGFGATAHRLSSVGVNIFSLCLCGSVSKRVTNFTIDEIRERFQSAISKVGISLYDYLDFPNLELHHIKEWEIVSQIERAICSLEPDLIVTHSQHDLNQDHRITFHACHAALRISQRMGKSSMLPALISCEILSATDWNLTTSSFNPNLFFSVSRTDIDAKIEACRAFGDILRKHPHSRSVQCVEALATLRGAAINSFYAEAFEAIALPC